MIGSMTRKDHVDATAVVLLVGCCVFWGFQQLLVKLTLPELPPVFQAAVRFIGATVLVLAWAAMRRIPLFERDGSWPAGLLAGLLFSAEFVGIYVGLQHTTVSRLTIFVYTSPLWVAAVLPLVVKVEALRPAQVVGLLLAFGGVVLAMADGARSQGLAGDLMAIAAGAAWGLTTVVIRASKLSRIPAEKLLLYQVACSSVLLPVLSLALGERWPSTVSTFALWSLVIQTVVGAFATYLLWMWLIGRYPATHLSSFTFLTPVVAVAAGAIWLGEPVTLALLLALVGVAAGIYLVNRAPRIR
jgi:drug/metabolite transporter (DMT)-like permease